MQPSVSMRYANQEAKENRMSSSPNQNAIQMATSCVSELVFSMGEFDTVSGFLEFEDSYDMKPISEEGWEDRLKLIDDAARALIWIMGKSDSWGTVVEVSFEDLCFLDSPVIKVDVVRDHIRQVIVGWLDQVPIVREVLPRWLVLLVCR